MTVFVYDCLWYIYYIIFQLFCIVIQSKDKTVVGEHGLDFGILILLLGIHLNYFVCDGVWLGFGSTPPP